MKKSLKIFFILLAIAIMCVGIYFTFFGYDTKLSVYKNTISVMSYKYNLGFNGDLMGLNMMGYNDNSLYFNEEEHLEIMTIRSKLFSDDKLLGGTEESGYLEYYGYKKYEEIISSGIEYYSNYLSLASHVKKSHSNAVSSTINYYRSSIANVYNLATTLQIQQNNFGKENGVDYATLLNSYKNLRNAYRYYLEVATDLLIDLRDYVVSEAFNNSFYFETKSILFDSLAETINIAMTSKIEQEINYLHDATLYVDKYIEYLETGSISYGITDEVTYLLTYKDLYLNSLKDYKKIFAFTHFQKYDLIHGHNNVSATISLEYIEKASIVLGLLDL